MEEPSNFLRTSLEAYFGKKIENSNFFHSKVYFQIEEPNSLKSSLKIFTQSFIKNKIQKFLNYFSYFLHERKKKEKRTVSQSYCVATVISNEEIKSMTNFKQDQYLISYCFRDTSFTCTFNTPKLL